MDCNLRLGLVRILVLFVYEIKFFVVVVLLGRLAGLLLSPTEKEAAGAEREADCQASEPRVCQSFLDSVFCPGKTAAQHRKSNMIVAIFWL